MLPLLVNNHRLLLLHMNKRFIWPEETGKRINEFDFVYIINPSFYVNKSFKEQVDRIMNTTFGELAQPFIKATLSKKNTSVLELIIFRETRG